MTGGNAKPGSQAGPAKQAKEWPVYVVMVLLVVLYFWNERAILQVVAPSGSYVHMEGRKPTLRTLPGYRWRAEWIKLLGTTWVPGAQDSTWHIIAQQKEGYYLPQPGYVWRDTSKPATWTPGLGHPQHANVIAAAAEGHWQAAPGYRFLSQDSLAVAPVYSAPAATPSRERSSDDTARSLAKLGVGALGCKLAESEEDDTIITGVFKHGMRAQCESMMDEAIGELAQ